MSDRDDGLQRDVSLQAIAVIGTWNALTGWNNED